MSSADHLQTDGQNDRVNRILEDVLCNVCTYTPRRWSSMLSIVEFAINNVVYASTGYTPFYVNGLAHTLVPLALPLRCSGLVAGEVADRLADVIPASFQKQVSAFPTTISNVLRHVRGAMADRQTKQKE